MRRILLVAATIAAGLFAHAAQAGLLAEYDAGSGFTTICSSASGGSCTNTFTASNGLVFTGFGATSNSPGTPTDANVLQATVRLTNPTATAQSLFLRVGDTDYAAPTGAVTLLNSIAGTVVTGGAGNVFNSTACADPTNSQNLCPGATYQTGTIFAFVTTPGAGSNSSTTPIANLAAPYGLSELLQITLDPGANINFSASSDVVTNATEPGGLAVLGLGLVGLGLVRARSRASG